LNTQKISDRIIEPITLTDNYNSVCGFEIETQLNKYYNLERITEVIQLEDEQQFHQLHQLDEMDVFGFSEKNGQKFTIELLVSLRAYILLKEQYPKIENHITKEINSEKYRVKIDVNNPKPITRFILGLKEDIEVVGSESFLKHLLEFD
jgi:predicted DNA-binding transcriptional regulator YafY